MNNKINIAIDAMGGVNAPKKIIEGIKIYLKSNKDFFFYLYGRQEEIEKELNENKEIRQFCEIIDVRIPTRARNRHKSRSRFYQPTGQQTTLTKIRPPVRVTRLRSLLLQVERFLRCRRGDHAERVFVVAVKRLERTGLLFDASLQPVDGD